MTNIVKQGSSLYINGDVNTFPFKNGKISLPLNSLYFVIDESNTVSFKQVNDNNTLLTIKLSDLQINGESVTKDNLIEKFDAVANGNVGGGNSTKLNEGSNITLTEEGDGSITISATGELSATVNWEDVQNKPNLATQEELVSSLSAKQDTLVSGTNIKTINGTSILGEGNIEIQGGGSGIADAPSDDKLYGRKNGNWSEVVLPDTSTFATKEEVNTKVDKVEGYSLIADTEIERLSTVTNYNDSTVKADIQSLKDNKADKTELANYLTTETASSTYQPIGDYATTTQLETKLDVETYNADKTTFALKSEIPDTSNLATKEEVNAKVSTETYNADKQTFALKSEIPNLSGYATEDWVESQGYLTEHQDISNLATKEELNSKLSTETYNADKPTFALKTEVENTYAKKTDIPDTSTFATKTELEGKADKTQIADMLTKTEAASTYQPIGSYLTEIPSEYITDSELNAKGYKKIEYKTQEEYNLIAEKEEGVLYVITDAPEIEIPDTSTFATKEEVNAKQDTLVSGTNIKTVNGTSILGSGDLVIATTQSWVGTQNEYDLINPKDANTLYFIVEEKGV